MSIQVKFFPILTDYHIMAKVPWSRIPSSLAGYQDIVSRQQRFHRYSWPANVSIVTSFLFVNIYIANSLNKGSIVSSGIVELLTLIMSIAILVAISRNNLYVRQLEDREIAQGYLYVTVYTVAACAILLWGELVILLSSTLPTPNLLSIGLIAFASTLFILGGSILIYYFSIAYPLQSWAAARIIFASPGFSLSQKQLTSVMNSVFRTKRRAEIRGSLTNIYDIIGISAKEPSEDDILDVETSSVALFERIIRQLPKLTTIAIALMNLIVHLATPEIARRLLGP